MCIRDRSKALISGEGGEKSGARITVDFALKQGREVYTLACNLSSPVAKLPLYLMESGAPAVQKLSLIHIFQGAGRSDAEHVVAAQSCGYV